MSCRRGGGYAMIYDADACLFDVTPLVYAAFMPDAYYAGAFDATPPPMLYAAAIFIRYIDERLLIIFTPLVFTFIDIV